MKQIITPPYIIASADEWIHILGSPYKASHKKNYFAAHLREIWLLSAAMNFIFWAAVTFALTLELKNSISSVVTWAAHELHRSKIVQRLKDWLFSFFLSIFFHQYISPVPRLPICEKLQAYCTQIDGWTVSIVRHSINRALPLLYMKAAFNWFPTPSSLSPTFCCAYLKSINPSLSSLILLSLVILTQIA